MQRRILHITSILVLVLPAFAAAGDWRQFRGTDNTGASEETGLATTFGDGENVAWKAPLPGRGPSSPIVVDGRVLVTASSGADQDRLHVVCLDAASGGQLWERQLWATGHTEGHSFGANAANTPASDGRQVYAFYSSNDLVCFDLDGNLKWFRGLAYEHPNTRNDVGMASSPVVVGDTVVVQLQNQGDSFAEGVDTETGETRWHIPREPDAMWCSPAVVRGPTRDGDIVVMQDRSRLTAHEPRTGKLLWDYEAGCHSVASATASGGTVYLPANGLHALRYDPATRTAEPLWYEQRLRSGNSSPVVSDGRVYVLKNPGIVVCGDAATGEVLWQLRLKGPFWATPVVAGGHLYAVSHEGLVQVVRLGDDEGELVGSSQIDKKILASPAVADGAIYFRSDEHLWKVAR